MDILRTLCSVPTVPFCESRVAEWVGQFVARRKNLALRADRFGNLLIELKSRARGPRWVFTAHMDHPGFVAGKMTGARTLAATFRGGVKTEFFRGSKVRFFDGEREIAGVIAAAKAGDPRRSEHHVTVKVQEAVKAGTLGMFDQGEGRYKSGKFFSRVCDDLAGAAACLAMLDQLSRKPPRSPVAVLLTRAEEVGFVGCIAACEHQTLLRKTDRVIAIECSSEQPYAPQRNGVILRVGDRTSIFNSALTYFMGQQAEELKKRDKSFKYQRALMPGGTCEATVYDVFGYTAASLCVALGNYHNMDVKRKKIGPEYVDVADWKNMVKLFVRLAQHGHEFKPGHGMLRGRILKRFGGTKKFL
jgi:putative aminopeptidase FrvX